MCGEKIDLKNNDEILKIQSPKNQTEGPFIVVYKNIGERWAIVALNWNCKPRLGIRWFYGNSGNPFSTGHPTWFIIPKELTKMILTNLPIDHKLSHLIDKFLSGEIIGEKLSMEGKNE